jgi:hypothetical protein
MIGARIFLMLTLVSGAIGCSGTPAFQQMMSQSFGMMKPSTGDYDDGTDSVDEGWVREAGIEARGDRPVEKENDPFRVFMSPKARSIERNLGFD